MLKVVHVLTFTAKSHENRATFGHSREDGMRKGVGERDEQGVGNAGNLDEVANHLILRRGPEGTLTRSALLTVLSFVTHVLYLIFADPSQRPSLSKESVYFTSAIPLCFGVLFLVLSVYSFTRLTTRTLLHIGFLLLALSFGSLCVQGLLGIGLHYVHLELQTW